MLLVEVPNDWPWDVVGMVGHLEEEFPIGGSCVGDGIGSGGGLEVGFSCHPSVGFEEYGTDFDTLVGSL